MKKCVVSFADTPFYQTKMKRLEESLKGNFDGDFLGFTNVNQIGSPTHQQIPYAFKPYAIQKAIDLGYELILWCDSPVHAIKSIEPVFDHIEKHGYLFFDNIGHPLGRWTNDKCLEYFNISRQEAMDIQQIMACCMGFDMRDASVYYLFKDYMSELYRLYHGSWDNHRHDQSVMSCLLATKFQEKGRQDFNILNGHDTYFIYEHFRNVFTISESVCLVSS